MDRRFLALFAITTTLLVLAGTAASSAASGGDLLAGAVATALAIPALVGLGALARTVYLNGKSSAARRDGTHS